MPTVRYHLGNLGASQNGKTTMPIDDALLSREVEAPVLVDSELHRRLMKGDELEGKAVPVLLFRARVPGEKDILLVACFGWKTLMESWAEGR